MNRTMQLTLLTLVSILLFGSHSFAGNVRLELEGGIAFQTKNDFAVPGDSGTRVSLENDEAAALRASLHWDFSRKWTLRFLAAPLRLQQELTASQPVLFQETLFAPGQTISSNYRFDSYRATAYYRFAPRGNWSYRLGITAKVRDAEIRLEGIEGVETKKNTGAVPLIYGGVRYETPGKIAVDVEADALGAPQGRAIDILARLEFPLSKKIRGYAGYRILDGGADNDEVYTFSTFQYAVAGLAVTF